MSDIHFKILACAGACALAAGVPALGDGGERYEFSELHMGVRCTVTLHAAEEETGREAARGAFELLAALDAAMSDYRRDSEVSRLNASAGGGPLSISDDLARVLDRARRIARLSDGAFDPTVGPVIELWRTARDEKKLPHRAELDAARLRTGWQDLFIDAEFGRAGLRRAGMTIDLGGIGKGYAAQRAVELLGRRGFGACMVALAGDIAVGDAPPGAPGWAIRIHTGLAPDRTILVEHASVSTSGDIEQFVEIDGVRYSHILDPRTGLGLTNRRAAAVVSADGALADACATALCVTGGLNGGLRELLGGSQWLIVMQDAQGKVVETASEGWRVQPQRIEVDGAAHNEEEPWDARRGHNEPPVGFTALFDGASLRGWRPVAGDPPVLAAMRAPEREAAIAAATESMAAHWSVEHGAMRFDGAGPSIQVDAPSPDFDLMLDWKIEPGGDSGIYLRGCPQVQIWDNPVGSGGLYNNLLHSSTPLVRADRPVGEWNRFWIRLLDDRVTVFLNDQLVVDDVPLENYWDRASPLPEDGPIELQAHGTPLSVRNVFARGIPRGSAATFDPRLAWWREARFGMFIHWGLYAVPAGRWNGRTYGGPSEWLMHYAEIPPKEYELLAARFNPLKFDAVEWARVAADAGMKYVVITSKHHEGFSLHETATSDYDVMDATPFKRDIMRELADAVRARGLRIGWYHSILDWHDPDAGSTSARAFPRYMRRLMAQMTELLTNYGPVSILWFDGEWIGEWNDERGRLLYRLCRRLQPGIIVNNRVGKSRSGMGGFSSDPASPGDFGTPEQEVPARGLPGAAWESCMTMNDSWGFKADDRNWKSVSMLIRTLAEVASKGGNLLLNVGPTAEGEIPRESVERLREMGEWLRKNGEAIYGTEAGPFERLPWGRCTRRGRTLYLHVFDWPRDGELRIAGLLTPVRSGRLLVGGTPLQTRRDGEDVVVAVPAAPPDPYNTVIVLELGGEAALREAAVSPDADGSITLRASDARTTGSSIRYEARADRDCLGFWTDPGDGAEWKIRVPEGGSRSCRVELTWACENGSEGSTVSIETEGSALEFAVKATGSWGDFRTEEIGRMTAGAAEGVTVRIRALHKPGAAVMNLRSIRLIPD